MSWFLASAFIVLVIFMGYVMAWDKAIIRKYNEWKDKDA